MLKNSMLMMFLSIGLSTVFYNYVKDLFPFEPLILIILFSVLFIGFLIKLGIKSVIKSVLIIGGIQSLIMGLITYMSESVNYSGLRLVTLLISSGLYFMGIDKIKKIVESTILLPLGFINKTYNYNVFNLKKDNANLNLSIEAVDNLGNNGRDFEDYISKLYRALGYSSKTTMDLKEEKDLPESIMKRAGNGEQGADVLVFFNSPENINGKQYDGLIIQCKQYSNKVENFAIQEIVGSIMMYEKHFMKKLKPVVITNNYYTGPAMDLAKANDVILIDRDSLQELIKNSVESIKNVKESLVA